MEIKIILAPFKCSFCEIVKKEIPLYCKNKGWKSTQIVNTERIYDVTYYPQTQVIINGNIVEVLEGINCKEIINKLNKY